MPATQPDTLPPGDYPTFRVDVVRLRSGQERRYGDTVYEAHLKFSNFCHYTDGIRPGTWEPPIEDIKRLAAMLVYHYSVDATMLPDQHMLGLETRLEVCERVQPQVWRVLVRDPYSD